MCGGLPSLFARTALTFASHAYMRDGNGGDGCGNAETETESERMSRKNRMKSGTAFAGADENGGCGGNESGGCGHGGKFCADRDFEIDANGCVRQISIAIAGHGALGLGLRHPCEVSAEGGCIW